MGREGESGGVRLCVLRAPREPGGGGKSAEGGLFARMLRLEKARDLTKTSWPGVHGCASSLEAGPALVEKSEEGDDGCAWQA